MEFHGIPFFAQCTYKYIMVFNQAYSDLLAKLPASLINEAWIRLISRKRNPLSEKEASEINLIVESSLKRIKLSTYVFKTIINFLNSIN